MDSELAMAQNELIDTIGLSANVQCSTPLKEQLRKVSMITVFMHTIMSTIIAFLGLLCIQLIYSLMLSDVEEKTFEFGMLRALGFNKRNILITIIMQAFTFSIPGLLSGMAVAALLNFYARKILYHIV